jgi:hypothetical protein
VLISPAVAPSASHCLTHERRQKKLRRHSSFFPAVQLARVFGQIHAQHKFPRLRQTSVEDKLQREISVIAARRIKPPQVTPSECSTLRSRAKWSRRYIQHGIKFPAVTMLRLSIAMTDSHRRVLFPAIKSLDEGRGSAICSSSGGEQKFARLLPEPERKRSANKACHRIGASHD